MKKKGFFLRTVINTGVVLVFDGFSHNFFVKSQAVTSKQRQQAKKYRTFSLFLLAPTIFVIILVAYFLKRFWLGLLLAALAVMFEGIYAYRIGAIVPSRSSSKTRSFGKRELFLYILLGLSVAVIGLLIGN